MLFVRCLFVVGMLVTGSLITGTASAIPEPAPETWNESDALAFSQSVVGNTLGNYTLTNINGQPFDPGSLRGKPLVISFIYTSCYHVCPMITSHLARVVKIARDALGDDSFSVLTIGFDTAVDTPQRMHNFKSQQSIKIPDWHFLSGNAETIERFTADTGFIYFASSKGFDHMAQATIVDAEGKIYRQVYGEKFETPHLVEPLKELILGTPAKAPTLEGWINSVKLFCTVYDPTTGRYHFDYSIFVTIGAGLLSLGMIAFFIIHALRGARRQGPGV